MNSRKLKILHVVLSMQTGGLENGIVNLVNRSDTEKFQVDILCLRARGELADRITNPHCRIIFDLDVKHSIKGAIQQVHKVCREGGYHIIHSHGWTTLLASYLGRFFSGTPIIINGEHGTMYFDNWKQVCVQRFLFKRVDLNLSVCAALRDEVARRFNVSKSLFKPILNGVNTEKFQPDDHKRQQMRVALNLSDDTFFVGSVGRLVECKNYPNLIRGFALFAKLAPNVKLALVGDGPDRIAIEELIEELNISDQVMLLGRRNDVPDLIRAFDVFVLPSFREGLSNTVLEAMSCGKPVVVTRVGGNPEIVDEGRTGFMYDVDDDEQLAGHLNYFYKHADKLSLFSEQSRQHIVHNFSLDGMVRNYEQTYLDVVLKRGLTV